MVRCPFQTAECRRRTVTGPNLAIRRGAELRPVGETFQAPFALCTAQMWPFHDAPPNCSRRRSGPTSGQLRLRCERRGWRRAWPGPPSRRPVRTMNPRRRYSHVLIAPSTGRYTLDVCRVHPVAVALNDRNVERDHGQARRDDRRQGMNYAPEAATGAGPITGKAAWTRRHPLLEPLPPGPTIRIRAPGRPKPRLRPETITRSVPRSGCHALS